MKGPICSPNLIIFVELLQVKFNYYTDLNRHFLHRTFYKSIFYQLPDPKKKKKKKGILKYPPKYAFEAQQIQFSVKTTEVSRRRV